MTSGGPVGVEVMDGKAGLIKVDMGMVTFQSNLIPVGGAVREVVDEPLKINGEVFRITCLSIGNPHCVILTAEVSKELALKLGPSVEHHPMFPKRINMQLLKVLDRNNIQIEIWERGAGYTLASGSSSCAAASSAFRLGKVDRNINVHMPGGVIQIRIHEEGHVHMTGPATGIAQGMFMNDFRQQVKSQKSLDK